MGRASPPSVRRARARRARGARRRLRDGQHHGHEERHRGRAPHPGGLPLLHRFGGVRGPFGRRAERHDEEGGRGSEQRRRRRRQLRAHEAGTGENRERGHQAHSSRARDVVARLRAYGAGAESERKLVRRSGHERPDHEPSDRTKSHVHTERYSKFAIGMQGWDGLDCCAGGCSCQSHIDEP